MGNTRTNDDGFKGEYPAPLDWDQITAELSNDADKHKKVAPDQSED